MQTHSDRLAALRTRLAAAGLHGFLVPRADRHQGETVPPADERLAWLTGFTGSAGIALILQEAAALIVDGRYELQGAAQLAAAGLEGAAAMVPQKDLEDWIKKTVPAGAEIGFDPWLTTPGSAEAWEKRLGKAKARLRALPRNPIDALWTDRPAPPAAEAYARPERLAGESAAAKRARIAAILKEEALDAAALTLPDSIAWLLNIRGADIPHTPVALAFALLDADGAVRLYSDPAKFPAELRATLGNEVSIEPWEAFEPALAALKGRRVAVEKASAPRAVADILEKAGAEIVWRRDPVSLPKARKNAAEIEGARAAHRRDGAAMAEALAWIEAEAPGGGLTEKTVYDRLTEIRAATAERLGSSLVDVSFSPIVGFGPNGAIVHYRVSEESSLPIAEGGLLLLDSGGQYPDGTTDVTRTVSIGAPPPEAAAIATRVLQGMIAVSRLVFPAETAGRQLDAFARLPLWRAGLDYDHGTGHGVGAFLGVHEGPIGLSKRYDVPFEKGMILSNEPGCYLEGRFGIRIENLLLVTAAEKPAEGLGPEKTRRAMHGFETLTLIPFDRRLIAASLLSEAERAWIDAYHRRVLQEIAPLTSDATQAWLSRACAPLPRNAEIAGPPKSGMDLRL